ncbi:MAG: hypothetical protein J6W96_00440 [Alphaproteobacteria bacterium]|nr:hypothetical protein [Alphaproteobacteria bacterium]
MEKDYIVNIKSNIQKIRETYSDFTSYRITLVKVLIPLLIIVMGYYACSSSQRGIHQNMIDIFNISDEIRSYYANKPDYWGLDTHFVAANKIIPNKFIRQNRIILSSGAEIFIGNGERAEQVMPLSKSFDIILRQQTKAQCISYAETVLSKEQLLKINSIQIINMIGQYTFEWGGKYQLPIKKYATKDICIDGANTLIWSIK